MRFPAFSYLRAAMVATSIVAISLLGTHTSAQAQSTKRCFTETGFCIDGRIREYWEQNGGLAVFGYPISTQSEETTGTSSYQTQWFERMRLELHPENQRPYDVLIGRVGVETLSFQGRDWFTFPQAGTTDGNAENCRLFAETNHTVCGDFLSAFKSHGLDLGQPGVSYEESLALFGLPISQPMTETLEDGRNYTVQWFERGRFELHPENQEPYRVLFGRLGAILYNPTTNTTPKATAITGTINYLERVALPNNAVVSIQLVDISVADAPATVIAEQNITTNGKQVPLSFELSYDDSKIDPSHTYAVRAQILIDGKLRFTSTTVYPVITNGSSNVVQIEVSSV